MVLFSEHSEAKNRLTIERVNSEKGYTKDNVIAVCYWANELKSVLFETDNAKMKYSDALRISRFLVSMDRMISEMVGK